MDELKVALGCRFALDVLTIAQQDCPLAEPYPLPHTRLVAVSTGGRAHLLSRLSGGLSFYESSREPERSRPPRRLDVSACGPLGVLLMRGVVTLGPCAPGGRQPRVALLNARGASPPSFFLLSVAQPARRRGFCTILFRQKEMTCFVECSAFLRGAKRALPVSQNTKV